MSDVQLLHVTGSSNSFPHRMNLVLHTWRPPLNLLFHFLYPFCFKTKCGSCWFLCLVFTWRLPRSPRLAFWALKSLRSINLSKFIPIYWRCSLCLHIVVWIHRESLLLTCSWYCQRIMLILERCTELLLLREGDHTQTGNHIGIPKQTHDRRWSKCELVGEFHSVLWCSCITLTCIAGWKSSCLWLCFVSCHEWGSKSESVHLHWDG